MTDPYEPGDLVRTARGWFRLLRRIPHPIPAWEATAVNRSGRVIGGHHAIREDAITS